MWTVVKFDSIKNTCWDKINENKVVIDKDLIDQEFAKKVFKPVEDKKTDQPKIVKKINLFDGDRVKNVELILQKLKLSYPLITKAIFECDDKILTLGNMDSLISIGTKLYFFA